MYNDYKGAVVSPKNIRCTQTERPFRLPSISGCVSPTMPERRRKASLPAPMSAVKARQRAEELREKRKKAEGFVFTRISCLDPPKVVPERKRLLMSRGRAQRWKLMRPYYGYCEFCDQKNYDYGALFCGAGVEKKKDLVNWTKVIDADETGN